VRVVPSVIVTRRRERTVDHVADRLPGGAVELQGGLLNYGLKK